MGEDLKKNKDNSVLNKFIFFCLCLIVVLLIGFGIYLLQKHIWHDFATIAGLFDAIILIIVFAVIIFITYNKMKIKIQNPIVDILAIIILLFISSVIRTLLILSCKDKELNLELVLDAFYTSIGTFTFGGFEKENLASNSIFTNNTDLTYISSLFYSIWYLLPLDLAFMLFLVTSFNFGFGLFSYIALFFRRKRKAKIYVFNSLDENSIKLANSLKNEGNSIIIFYGNKIPPYDSKNNYCKLVSKSGFYYIANTNNDKSFIKNVIIGPFRRIIWKIFNGFSHEIHLFSFLLDDNLRPATDLNSSYVFDQIEKIINEEYIFRRNVNVHFHILANDNNDSVIYQAKYKKYKEKINSIKKRNSTIEINLASEPTIASKELISYISSIYIKQNEEINSYNQDNLELFIIGFGGLGQEILNKIYANNIINKFEINDHKIELKYNKLYARIYEKASEEDIQALGKNYQLLHPYYDVLGNNYGNLDIYNDYIHYYLEDILNNLKKIKDLSTDNLNSYLNEKIEEIDSFELSKKSINDLYEIIEECINKIENDNQNECISNIKNNYLYKLMNENKNNIEEALKKHFEEIYDAPQLTFNSSDNLYKDMDDCSGQRYECDKSVIFIFSTGHDSTNIDYANYLLSDIRYEYNTTFNKIKNKPDIIAINVKYSSNINKINLQDDFEKFDNNNLVYYSEKYNVYLVIFGLFDSIYNKNIISFNGAKFFNYSYEKSYKFVEKISEVEKEKFNYLTKDLDLSDKNNNEFFNEIKESLKNIYDFCSYTAKNDYKNAKNSYDKINKNYLLSVFEKEINCINENNLDSYLNNKKEFKKLCTIIEKSKEESWVSILLSDKESNSMADIYKRTTNRCYNNLIKGYNDLIKDKPELIKNRPELENEILLKMMYIEHYRWIRQQVSDGWILNNQKIKEYKYHEDIRSLLEIKKEKRLYDLINIIISINQ